MGKAPHGLIELPEGKIRVAPSGKVSVFDVIAAVTGDTNPRRAWADLAKRHPEVVPKTYNFRFPGKGQRVTPVTDRQGFAYICLLLAGQRAAEYRKHAAQLIERYLDGDVTLAAEIVDRQEDPEKLAWLRDRIEGKVVNRLLNGAIHQHGGTCYASVARLNAQAATGFFPREIREKRGVRETRDGLDLHELAALRYAESLETRAIEVQNAQGDGPILGIVEAVTRDVEAMRQRHTKGLPAPAPLPALPAPVAPAAPPAPASAPPSDAAARGRALLALLAGRGIEVVRDDQPGMLRLRGVGPKDAGMRDLAIANKPDLLAALASGEAETRF